MFSPGEIKYFRLYFFYSSKIGKSFDNKPRTLELSVLQIGH